MCCCEPAPSRTALAPLALYFQALSRKDFAGNQDAYSLIVAPWGEVLAEAGTDPGVIVADIDPKLALEARTRIPSLRHDRSFEAP